MRFNAKFSPVIDIILWTMAAVSVVGLVCGALVMFGVNVAGIFVGQARVLVGFCPVSALLSVLFATIHYKVTNTHLQLKIAFWDMLGGRIEIGKILNIVIKDGKMYVSYLWKGPDPVIARIAISPKKYEQMKAILTVQNPNIQFWNDDEAVASLSRYFHLKKQA